MAFEIFIKFQLKKKLSLLNTDVQAKLKQLKN